MTTECSEALLSDQQCRTAVVIRFGDLFCAYHQGGLQRHSHTAVRPRRLRYIQWP
jgi:hypothetical protein